MICKMATMGASGGSGGDGDDSKRGGKSGKDVLKNVGNILKQVVGKSGGKDNISDEKKEKSGDDSESEFKKNIPVLKATCETPV